MIFITLRLLIADNPISRVLRHLEQDKLVINVAGIHPHRSCYKLFSKKTLAPNIITNSLIVVVLVTDHDVGNDSDLSCMLILLK